MPKRILAHGTRGLMDKSISHMFNQLPRLPCMSHVWPFPWYQPHRLVPLPGDGTAVSSHMSHRQPFSDSHHNHESPKQLWHAPFSAARASRHDLLPSPNIPLPCRHWLLTSLSRSPRTDISRVLALPSARGSEPEQSVVIGDGIPLSSMTIKFYVTVTACCPVSNNCFISINLPVLGVFRPHVIVGLAASGTCTIPMQLRRRS